MKNIIIVIFITSLLIANVVTAKILNIFGLIVPGAAICYAITFLMTDLMSEIYGKKAADQLVRLGILSLVISLVLIKLTQYLPAAGFAKDQDQAYNILLGQNWRFIIASLIAYIISQSWDVWIFHYLKKRTKYKWIRNNISTMTSQLIDTAIFITIAFYGMVPDLLWMVFSQYILKFIISLIDTIPFYLLTKNSNK